MEIPLSPAPGRLISRQIKSGNFENTGEVINAALRQMALADSWPGSAANPADLPG